MGAGDVAMAEARHSEERAKRGDALPPLGDFISKAEAAALLRKSPETIDKLRKSTRWRRGVHWFQPNGSRPLYSRSALEAWVRAGEPAGARVDSPHGSRCNLDVVS